MKTVIHAESALKDRGELSAFMYAILDSIKDDYCKDADKDADFLWTLGWYWLDNTYWGSGMDCKKVRLGVNVLAENFIRSKNE